MAFMQYVKSSSSSKNYAYEVSVFKCGDNESNRMVAFFSARGDIRFKNNNITNNKCEYHSLIYSYLQGSSGSYNFSTFRDNNQTGGSSLAFVSDFDDSYNHTFSHCNVIGIKCGTDYGQMLFTCWYTTNVDQCVFLNNTAVYMFHQDKEDYTLTISDSYIEVNTTTGSGNVTFNNLKENYDFNVFSHIYKEKCYIEKEKTINNKISYFF
ncbi:hypothetical protein TVAG_271890 [Trichomonas vaginalis G3]|uniref:Uncharacterized protein n=1 Tax=Trichomonas vaginalis (strain ATCC PRA-98 / G3) TaxID=412133 RepID=A2E5T6_TRIV3|nr:hypothetical protein TVAGG3_0256930 [Trichomonas vaginalis G3]EAY12006.1 hypothetical protein TVAG_271890 [Trichomonas vaginalis G3]KAI5524820.1 hypothetical protein TVAGG3_0256930 [Trichomonas vaginalis G3]|eukprot:XP_001324229.1 hypothetical protein [Trichomonas vaginalis G3]